MKPYRKFKPFQLRWREALGDPEDPRGPYLYRWTLLLFNFSIRIHHWIRSDDTRFFHDHQCNLVSVVLKGWYYNVKPTTEKCDVLESRKTRVEAGSIWYADALQRHYLDIPTTGAWTLLICGRPYHKWGFYVNGKKKRPLKYFYKYGYQNG
jgi:hypothetical protein